MKFEIRDSQRGVRWTTVSELFEAVGWGIRPPEQVAKAFDESTFVRFAFVGDKLIGFGRTVDDGQYYGLIVDLVVDPAYQGQGVGARLLQELRDCLSEYEFCTLTSAPNKEGFYIRQGWSRQTSAFIWPKDNEQKSQHATGG